MVENWGPSILPLLVQKFLESDFDTVLTSKEGDTMHQIFNLHLDMNKSMYVIIKYYFFWQTEGDKIDLLNICGHRTETARKYETKRNDSWLTKVSLLGVESLWDDCTFIPADWGSDLVVVLCYFALLEDFSL